MKFLTKSVVTIFAFLFLFGCASQQVTEIPSLETKKFDANNYTSKVDNFIIILDASSSMRHSFGKSKKFDIAKTLVYGMNTSIPEFGQTAGLRSFGHAPDLTQENTKIFYGMEKYSTANLEKGADKITKAGGFSPLNLALDAVVDDLDGLSGNRNAVVIISDGEELPSEVLASAKKIKERYGDSICFYPVLVGDNKKGETLFKDIARMSECGFFSTADELMSYAGMGQFVEMVFLDEKPAAPPAPVALKINDAGDWVLDNVLFDFDKDVIKSEAYPVLNHVVGLLEKQSTVKIEVYGHCDNVGSDEYNMDLSLRRANAVKNYLVGKGIAANRLSTKGFGFTKPVALNGTESGRALNRRVELHRY